MAHPSFADRLIDAWEWTFAPQRLMQRSYEAARLKFDHKTRFSTFAAEVPMALHQARSRSRHGAENSAYFQAALRALNTHITGAGIVPASTHPGPAVQALLADAWARFSDACDYDGLTNMAGLQSAIVGDWLRDGEGVALLRNTPEGLRIQRIAADQIDDSQTRDLGGGAFIQSGIEFDASGRRVAFWLFPQNPANTSALNLQPVRVDAQDVIHMFEPRGPGQTRGMPMGTAALKRNGEIDQTENALLEGVKVAALFCGIVTDENGPAAPPFTEGEQSGGTLTTPPMEPGAMLNLGAGKKVTFPAPMHAAQGVEFLASQIRAVASAFGVPPQFIDSDYSRANFSSLRSSLAIYAARLDQLTHTIVRPMLLDRIWRRWITTEVLAGRIEAPTFESDSAVWFGVEWFPPAPPTPDDLKAAQADALQITHGLKSRGQAIRERGYAPELLDAEIAAERERAQRLGLSFAATGQGQTSNEDEKKKAANDDDEET